MPTESAASAAIARAEELNRWCHCISVDTQLLERALESGPGTAGMYAALMRTHPTLFSASSVFLAREHLVHMQAVIEAVESVVHSVPFGEWAFSLAPTVARQDHGPRGVFLGYDFHVGHTGPQLIEINTNAGGALLNAALARAQQACCVEVSAVVHQPCDAGGVEEGFVAMFRAEWQAQRGAAPLRRIAIVDERPDEQYLFPEFLLFQQLFRNAGIDALIADPRALRYEQGELAVDGAGIDLVYNRLTDFMLAGDDCTALRAAYEDGAAVVTPNPHIYACYADKRHLTVLSDTERLRDWGINADTVELLAASVPRTIMVSAESAAALWQGRKQFFFKPVDGYGGKAAYRGDKLTRGTWEQILTRPYVAQHVVPPSERTIVVDGQEVPLKLDVRNYVYDRRVQLVAARLYRGQTTNFRTAGGGFAPVFTQTA
jgi:hypothetical protein